MARIPAKGDHRQGRPNKRPFFETAKITGNGLLTHGVPLKVFYAGRAKGLFLRGGFIEDFAASHRLNALVTAPVPS